MEKTSLTCVICPMGCRLDLECEDGKVVKVEGNSCLRGVKYAESEYTNPVRTLTTTVKLEGGGLLPVRTSRPISRDKLFEAIERTKRITVRRPIARGESIAIDFIDRGCCLVACKTVE